MTTAELSLREEPVEQLWCNICTATAGECQGVSVIDDFHAVILADDHLFHNIILRGNDFTADIFLGTIKTFFFLLFSFFPKGSVKVMLL